MLTAQEVCEAEDRIIAERGRELTADYERRRDIRESHAMSVVNGVERAIHEVLGDENEVKWVEVGEPIPDYKWVLFRAQEILLERGFKAEVRNVWKGYFVPKQWTLTVRWR